MAETIFKATVMHNGWEMDNEAWILEYNGGYREIRTTSHGREYVMGVKELDEKIKETEGSLNGLIKLKKLWEGRL